jgi:two-component system response regulator NreC
MASQKLRIAIVEDEQIFSELLAMLLAKLVDCELVGTANDGEKGWQLCLAKRPDMVMLDINMPKLDGLEMGERLLAKLPESRLLAMSGLTDPYTIWRISRSGVHGYLDKTQDVESWSTAIREVAAGRRFFSPVFNRVKTEWLAQPEAFQKILSEREQAVLRLVVAGWEDARIGSELAISAATVETHRKHIRQKLELHNDRELVAYARKWGLSPPAERAT